MFPIDRLIFIAAILLILGVLSSKLSSRMGLPVLVVFLLVGMLAGSEGVGRIYFENYALSHQVGTLALAMILFDGGLRTSPTTLRTAVRPAVTLATAGVFLTAVITAAASRLILDLSWTEAMLLGSIVSSTDAAAVFAVLRSRSMQVRERLAATLEVESGSNDPMAVIMTIACIELLLGRIEAGPVLVWLFLKQLGVGAIVGWGVGRVAVVLLNRVHLGVTGLYPVLASAFGLLAFGTAAVLGGSGFLAVYIAGILLGAGRLPYRSGLFVFHDGLAWLSQIAMFVVLGLLSFPSRLVSTAGPGILVSAVLILAARPLAVGLCLLPFRYTFKESLFIAAGGLKGAVPIILATYPLLAGLPHAEALFDVVFFVVLVSAVTQGWTLPPLGRLLGVSHPPTTSPPVMLEISSLRDVDADIVEYTVTPDSHAAGHRVRDLVLPDGALVAMIVRGSELIPPRGSTPIQDGDHVFVLMRTARRSFVDRIFGRSQRDVHTTRALQFPLRGTSRIADIEAFYGVHIDAPGAETLDEFLRARLGGELRAGQSIAVGPVLLTAQDVVDGRVETVGLSFELDG